jgi:hypothetical protein
MINRRLLPVKHPERLFHKNGGMARLGEQAGGKSAGFSQRGFRGEDFGREYHIPADPIAIRRKLSTAV